MNIYIKVDVHPTIGIGHIMRCLNFLSYYDNSKYNFSFICKKYKNINLDTEKCINKIYKKIQYQYKIHFIELENDKYIEKNNMESWLGEPYHEDANKTIKIIQDGDIIIIDHYAIDKRWELIIKNHVKKIIVIEDFIKRKHYCDILINCTVNENCCYKDLINDNCDFKLGMNYAIINNFFYNQDIQKREINRISIFISGSDNTNETEKIIKFCNDKKLNNKFIFDVIIGALNKNYSSIKNFCEKNKNFNIYYNISNIYEIFNRSYISIGALGQSQLERIALKLPSIVISISENQNNTIANLINSNTFLFLGSIPIDYNGMLEKSIENICNKEIYLKMQKNCKEFLKKNNIKNILH